MRNSTLVLLAAACGLLAMVLVTFLTTRHASSGSNHRSAAVAKQLKDSQLAELKIYMSPKTVRQSDLDRFWLPLPEGGTARAKIEAQIRHLLEVGKRYGVGTRNVKFLVKNIRFESPDSAIAETEEAWHLVVVDAKGKVEKSEDIPLDVTYRLKRKKGTWLVESTTTPYKS